MAATWDGNTCAAEPLQGLSTGVAHVTFENNSGGPAGVLIIGLVAPHEWSEVEEMIAEGVDVEMAEPPDWIIEGALLSDATGRSGVVSGTFVGEAGTYGPICMAGLWPEVTLSPGESFEVSDSP